MANRQVDRLLLVDVVFLLEWQIAGSISAAYGRLS